MGERLFSNLKDAANAGERKNYEKTEARQGWQRAPGKHNFLFSAGNTRSQGYLWSLSGGRRGKREGGEGPAPSVGDWETVGPEEAAKSSQAAPEKALIIFTVSLSGRKGEVFRDKRGNGVEALFYLLPGTLSSP